MKYSKKIFTVILALIIFITSFCVVAKAKPSNKQNVAEIPGVATTKTAATDITDSIKVTYSENTIKVSCEKSFSQIYIEWKTVPKEWKLFDGKNETSYGTKGFLHEYIKLDDICNEVELRRSSDTAVKKLYAFTDGELPGWVQVWDEPCKKADLMLCTTHSDDEQLFFLGILPYYAGELGLNVQVVYFVNHNDTDSRPHELLNGLWTVGVRNYPMIGEAPDLYSESLDEAISGFKDYGYDEEYFIKYQVEAIRRFKPLIVVGHDVNGEYSHGAHILNTHTLRKALEISNDENSYPDLAKEYGTWDVPKTYLHLWKENQIHINWDVPLEKFGGKTAYEVSMDGFRCHESQHWTWFSKWIGLKSDWGVTKAADIKDYSPCEFGLYRTTVGQDTLKKDFLENIVLYGNLNEPDQNPDEDDSDKTDDNNGSQMNSATPMDTAGSSAAPENSTGTTDEVNTVDDDRIKKIQPVLILLTMIVGAVLVVTIVILIKRIMSGKI